MRTTWRMTSAGSLDRLTLVEEELPAPEPAEVRVRVEAVGLNFADVFACLGLYSATPKGSFIPGLECAGILEDVGPAAAARGLRVGDRVMVLTRFGAFATALNVDARYVLPMPPAWTAADGAAYPVQALTAWYGLVHLGRLAHDEIVLVRGRPEHLRNLGRPWHLRDLMKWFAGCTPDGYDSQGPLHR